MVLLYGITAFYSVNINRDAFGGVLEEGGGIENVFALVQKWE